VPLTVQVDADPAYVPDEIAELAEEAKPILSPQLQESLARCDARLDIMSTTPPKTAETESAITVFAQTDLDPDQPEVERVLLVLSTITAGCHRTLKPGQAGTVENRPPRVGGGEYR